jgi:hypothetical protein
VSRVRDSLHWLTSEQFVPAPALAGARESHTATLLLDGSVLAAGGRFAPTEEVLSSAERFTAGCPEAPLTSPPSAR